MVDSLVGGCIPVLFDPFTAYYQFPWHLPQNASSYSVLIHSEDVKWSDKFKIVKILRTMSSKERTVMREDHLGLLFSQPGTQHLEVEIIACESFVSFPVSSPISGHLQSIYGEQSVLQTSTISSFGSNLQS